jgi:hypothetical protein
MSATRKCNHDTLILDERGFAQMAMRLYRDDPHGAQAALLSFAVSKPKRPKSKAVREAGSAKIPAMSTGHMMESSKPGFLLAQERFPWDAADSEKKVKFQARLPEPLHLQLQFLAARLPGGSSIQMLLGQGAQQLADRLVADLVLGGSSDVYEARVSATSSSTPHHAEPMPWDNADRSVKVALQARIPERLHMKLVWLRGRLPGGPSVHELLLRGAQELVDHLLEQRQVGWKPG